MGGKHTFAACAQLAHMTRAQNITCRVLLSQQHAMAWPSGQYYIKSLRRMQHVFHCQCEARWYPMNYNTSHQCKARKAPCFTLTVKQMLHDDHVNIM
jgi:hypothetical protein